MQKGTIGGIVIIAIGAILAFAVQDGIGGVDLTMVGYILMAAGAVATLLGIVFSTRSAGRVSETRTVNDPASGERITRHETNGGI